MNKAVILDSGKDDAYFYLAITYNNKGEYDKAIETYQKVIDLDSTKVYYYTSIWRTQYNAADDKDAVKPDILNDITETLKKYPDNVSLYSSLRYLYRTMGEEELALKAEDRMLALDTTGMYTESEAYSKIFQKSNNKERIKAAEEFLEKYPKGRMRKYVYSMMFRYAQQESKYKNKELEGILNQWFGEFPKDVSAYYAASRNFYLKDSKTCAKAIEFATKGLEISNRRMKPYFWDAIGWANYKLGSYDEAVQALIKAYDLFGDTRNTEVIYHLGAAYLEIGNIDKSIEYLVQSLAVKEDKEVRDTFYKAYKKKFATRKGAADYLNKAILDYTAVDKPFPAPDFTLASLGGGEVTFSDHIGKVILVNFWKPG